MSDEPSFGTDYQNCVLSGSSGPSEVAVLRCWHRCRRRAIGRGACVDGERFELPVPEVVGPPPLQLVEEAGVDSAVHHRRSTERELALVVLGLV